MNPALWALLALASLSFAGDGAALNAAAGLYHQARFDSARVRLEALLADGSWRRRDSLVLHQYLGMSASRLGRDAEAVARFGALLAIDSLFRFPRNEDPAVLRNFRAARDARIAVVTPPAPPPPVPASIARAPAESSPAPAPAAPPEPGLAASARSAIPTPGDPLRLDPAPPSRERPAMNLALGAVPLGGGWMARERMGHGLSLGILQAGGILLSVYASERQTEAGRDRAGNEASERPGQIGWQWVQRVSLSTALGAYLYSIFASGRK